MEGKDEDSPKGERQCFEELKREGTFVRKIRGKEI